MSNFIQFALGLVFMFVFGILCSVNIDNQDYGAAAFNAILALYWGGHSLIYVAKRED